ncbi:spermidine synthase [uncultured Sphingomonas sp.]|uniref:spermidine synthase n=1 Tax=uncultured Sphingomonas sp. TaxID=158754 RepID=UPI0035CB21D5
MIPRILLDTAQIPDGATLRLFQHGRDFAIMLGMSDLMNSRMSGSEEALATIGCTSLVAHPRPRVLVGGLGMGFTLRALLGVLGEDAEIVVAEIVPAIVAWARGPMASLFGDSLDDPRVTIRVGDVADAIAIGGWNAILLDVDNGPDGLTMPGNDRLYGVAGIARARAALVPDGVLAIWSAAPDKAFANRLRGAGLGVVEHQVRARSNGKGPRHVIWTATRAT